MYRSIYPDVIFKALRFKVCNDFIQSIGDRDSESGRYAMPRNEYVYESFRLICTYVRAQMRE